MNKFLRKIFLNLFAVGGGILTINIPQINLNENIDNLLLNDQNNPTNQNITTTTNQILAFHGNGWDTNVTDMVKSEVNFNQSIKRIFASESQPLISGNDAIINVDQLTTPDTSTNTGSYRWGNANYDTYHRVQDWKFQYIDNLKIKNHSIKGWGIDNADLFLNNTNTWPKGTDFHSLVGKVVFQNGSDQSYEYQKATDFNLHIGVNKKFNNKSFDFYSIPYSKLKEVQYVYVFDNFVRRYLWSLQGTETKDNLSSVQIKDNNNIKINKYKIKDLVCFTNPDYQNGTIQIKFNEEFIRLSQYTRAKNEKIKEGKLNNLTINAKNEFINAIDNYKVYDDNFDSCLDDVQKMTSVQQIKKYFEAQQSVDGLLAKKYHLNVNDDPLDTIKYLINLISLKLNYQIPSKSNPDVFENYQINVSNEELKNGKEIKLTKNSNGEYQIKLVNLTSNEYIDAQNYVASDVESNISVCSSNINGNVNQFTLKKPSIVSVSFNNESKQKDLYAYDLTNEQILSKYINTIDNYGTKNSGLLLDQNQYQIIRDEFLGQIYISVNLNGSNYQTVISGFKIPDLTSLKFDANKYSSMLLSNNINDSIAKEILRMNNFDHNIIKSCTFKLDDSDNSLGEATLKIVSSVNPDFLNELKDRKFIITNLLKYYIKPKENIELKILQKQPSKITTQEFLINFLDYSKEFVNLNKLQIFLNPDNKLHLLKAEIKYTDYFSKETKSLKCEFNFNNRQNLNNLWIISIVVTGVLILLVGMFLYKKDNLKRSN